MKISAIISEYNPLHKGHVYHINKTRDLTHCDALICIMSGNFVQRGLPAILDKWSRTEMALKSGIDLVIELPCIYSLSSAEFFAWGAVSLINSLNVVNFLSFGSECGDISLLKNLSHILTSEPESYKHYLKQELINGLPYAKARSNALSKYVTSKNNLCFKDLEPAMSSSNNILGIEYCKSLLKLNSKINPITIKREGANYNSQDLDSKFSSATSIRKFMKENTNINILQNHIPSHSFQIINNLYNLGYSFADEDKMIPFIKYKLLTGENTLINIPESSEGLHNKIYKEILRENNFENLVLHIKSKRYTFTRISRILCEYFIGFDAYDIKSLRSSKCSYARVLGFNSTGAKVLKEIKKHSTIPLITKIPKTTNKMLDLDLQSTKAYSLINTSIDYNKDYTKSPIIIK